VSVPKIVVKLYRGKYESEILSSRKTVYPHKRKIKKNIYIISISYIKEREELPVFIFSHCHITTNIKHLPSRYSFIYFLQLASQIFDKEHSICGEGIIGIAQNQFVTYSNF